MNKFEGRNKVDFKKKKNDKFLTLAIHKNRSKSEQPSILYQSINPLRITKSD